MQLSETSATQWLHSATAQVAQGEHHLRNRRASQADSESLACGGKASDRRQLVAINSAEVATTAVLATPHQSLLHKTKADILYQAFDRARLSVQQQQALALLEAQLNQLDFKPLGSMTTSRFANMVIHAYVHAQWSINAIVWQSDALRPVVDLYSTFRDGSNLTTSSMPGTGDLPQQQIFRNSYPASEPIVLLSRHHDRLAILNQENGLIRPACQQLRILALALEEYCQRQPSGFWHGLKTRLSRLGLPRRHASTVEPS